MGYESTGNTADDIANDLIGANDVLAAFTVRVETVEAMRDGAHKWDAAFALANEIGKFEDQVPQQSGLEDLHTALLALVARCTAADSTPSFSTEASKLASYEALTRQQVLAQGLRGVIESFAVDMEGALRNEHARAPQSARAIDAISIISRRARSLVWAR